MFPTEEKAFKLLVIIFPVPMGLLKNVAAASTSLFLSQNVKSVRDTDQISAY